MTTTEPTGSAQPLPAVTLDFSNKSGGAWDDRELVNAYDAALLEFHIHNPGPGSWLDKATAALAKGQPLPGANAFGTEWYAASRPKDDTQREGETEPEAEPEASSSRQPKRQRTTRTQPSVNPYTKPYTTKRAESPTYSPPSPNGPAGERGVDEDDDDVVVDEGGYAHEQGVEDEDAEEDSGLEAPEPHWDLYDYTGEGEAEGSWGHQGGAEQEGGYVFPAPSGEWPSAGSVSHDEAVGFALHAQYWAGYWMGVARASGGAGASRPPPPAVPGGRDGYAAANGNGGFRRPKRALKR